MLTTAQIETILTEFQVELSNFEIINIEEKKGWSSKYLFLVVEHSAQYVLKGKTRDQLTGYIADIEISNFLISKGFSARSSIKTKAGEYHFEQDGIYWELKTYIPGSVTNFVDYTDTSIISLAQVNTSYINASLNSSLIKDLQLEVRDIFNIKDTVAKLVSHKDILFSIVGDEPQRFIEWFSFAQTELSKILKKSPDFSIVHNDLNNKNILLDLHTDKVTSFIDWDHGSISTPLKDILEPLNTFYDYVPEKYEYMRDVYLKEIKASYQIQISESELNLLQVYFYALNKWEYIAFFVKMIEDVGDTSNELARFEDVVRTQLGKLTSLGKLHRVL